ncbi:MMPL family transporter [Streptomyces sp. RS10V-4]|uniref:MMPL family transporter n=1 Tax=Streptomyces rhizoryzae TaxID=2932493 RepID=UPI002004D8B9|nr:MMPL family transporter [Streptomyces rhizoryzae]MCK7622223.1 MMPL family transporter [Streptomyces rhizoryzae]
MRGPRGSGRWVVLGLAAGLAAVCAWFGASVHAHLSPGGIVPAGTEAARADRALQQGFGATPPHLVLVARVAGATGTVTDRGAVAEGERLVRRLTADRAVSRVVSYWRTRAPELRAANGRSALVLVRFRADEEAATRAAGRLVPRLAGRHGPLEVSVTGEAASRAEALRLAEQDQRRAELLALPLTALLLLVVFGSAVAALLPVAVGALAVLGATAVLRLLTSVTEVSVSATNVSSALGFALAVDYSLFLLARYREETASGAGPDDALRTTLRTSGRAVAFSAGTVTLSLAALLVFPHTILRSIAYGGIAVTAFAALGSLVVLPALLGVLGDRVDRFGIRLRLRRRRAPAPPADGTAGGPGRWGRTARAAMRRPGPVAVAVTALLLVLAAPFTRVQIGLFDDRVQPASSTVAEAGAVLREGYRLGAVIAPTTVVLPHFDLRRQAPALDAYARRIARQPGVDAVGTATGTYTPDGRRRPPGAPAAAFASARGVWLSVATPGEPYATANRDLVRALRALPAPAPALVGGPGAVLNDVQRALFARLPLCLALAAAALLALTLALTRRPVMALTALLLNALSLAASFGALVFVFQEGHLAGLVGGFPVTGTTDALMPALVFGIAFGLSMDYEILLLARVCEEYRRTAPDGAAAIVRGLDRTARLFTWAALTLAVVMAALATSELILLKIVGVGLALAVVLDATVVRGLLAPAVLTLAGRATWWSPWPPPPAPPPAAPAPRPALAPAGPTGAEHPRK